MPVATSREDRLNEKCAVFGVIAPDIEASRLAFYGLWALQHRGQESSGIVSTDGNTLFSHNADGLVASVYREQDLEKLTGTSAIGHNRYSTSGGQGQNFNQPFIHEKHQFALAHNGNIPDCTLLEEFLAQRSIDHKRMNDSQMMVAAIGCHMDDGRTLDEAIKHSYPLFTGVFSCVVLNNSQLIAFRDKKGIRPLSLARINGAGYCVASETCAFDTIGATFERDIKPGEMVTIDSTGLTSQQVVKGEQKLDIFEFVYFARPDSKLLGKRVNDVRKNFGEQMAIETNIKADIVVPVPDSAVPAASGYAQATNTKLEMALIKNRYIHRTFIRPTIALREMDLKMKLNPLGELLNNQRVVLVDDSIVRGATMRQVVSILFEAGAKEIHLLITSPPVRYPDFYGINTPKQEKLIASHMTVEEIRDYVGATSLSFLSYDGMVAATGLPGSEFSTSCFDGNYPISIGKRQDEIRDLASDQPLTTIQQTTVQPV